MGHKLSIIVPCYNSSATLEESIDSIYKQNLTTPFEIVMVDDKSTDKTAVLMQRLASIRPEIKLSYHNFNKGGGAARNTGIKHSEGSLIFCLDSDNLLPPNTMQKMIDYLIDKDCDGVVIHERRYFKERDQSNFESHFNKILKEPIRFEHLFDENLVLMDNFLYKRDAYNKTSGYPEKHGFDTQCFEVRFLAAGNNACVCPDTIFLHRQSLNSKGYFHRVYEEGLLSVNFYLIFEEVLHLFSQELIIDIIKYDIFSQNKLGNSNIKSFVSEKYREVEGKIFIDNYETYLIKDGAQKYKQHLNDPKTTAERFVKAVLLYHEKKYQDSYNLYLQLVREYPDSRVIKYNIARCELALEGRLAEPLIEKEAIKKCGYVPVTRKMVLNAHPFKVFLIKIKNYLKNS